MAGAFQGDAFQNDAFQLDETAQQPVSRANITASGVFRPAERIAPQRKLPKLTYTQARVTQVAVEVLLSDTAANARVTQVAVEVLLTPRVHSNRDKNITATGRWRRSARIAPQRIPTRQFFEGVSVVEGGFTADAVIYAEQSGSLTADALISLTVASSFTADAILLRTQTGSLTADGVLLRAQSGGFSADADISVPFSTVEDDFTADAVVLRTQSGSATADAVVLATRTASFTADAVIFRSIAGSFAADAVVMPTFTADAIVRREQSGSLTGDAYISVPGMGSFTADAVIQEAPTAPPIAHLQDIVAKRIWRAKQRILPERKRKLAPSNNPRTFSFTFTANAVIHRPIRDKHQRDIAWRGLWRPKKRARPQQAPLFPMHELEYGGSFTADAVVHIDGTWEYAFVADAWVLRIQGGALTADAVIKANISGSFFADAVIMPTFTANAIIRRERTGSFTADAQITQGYLRADAIIRVPRTGSFTANAVTKKSKSYSFKADAYLGNYHSGSFTADAWIYSTGFGQFSFRADAVIYDPSLPSQSNPGGEPVGTVYTGGYDIVITYDGSDITSDVVVRDASFMTRTNGNPGSARFFVRDDTHAFEPLTGKEITLDIGGHRVWGGYVIRAKKKFFFPAQDTTNAQSVVRGWEIEGLDYNVLFQKRIVFDPSDPAGRVDFSYDADTWDDTIIKDIFNNYLDISDLDLTLKIDRVDKPIYDMPGKTHSGTVASAGYTWGQMMSSITRATAGVYYISPNKEFVYTDADGDAVWTLTDQPSGTWDIPYRQVEILNNGSALVNDALVWGAASAPVVFSRVQDAASIAEHGRWQQGYFSPTMFRQASVNRVANSYVYGTPQSLRGGKDDGVTFTATVFFPRLHAGLKVRCVSAVHGIDRVLPVRSVEITFPTKPEAPNTGIPVMKVVASHEIDQPFDIFEQRWEKFRYPPPRIPDPCFGCGPELPPPPPPGGCDCGITDTFTRTVGPDAWGTSDAGIPWSWFGEAQSDASVANGVGVISATGGLPGSGPYVYVSLDDPAPPAPTDITFDVRITTQSTSGTGFCYMGGYYGGSAGEPHLWMVYEVGLGADVIPSVILGYRSSISGTSFYPDVDMTLTTGTWYSVRLHLVDGDFAALRIWERTDPEPTTWLLEQDVSGEPLWDSTYFGTNQAIFSFDAYTEEVGDNLAFEVDNLNVAGVNDCGYRFDDFNRTVSAGSWGGIWTTAFNGTYLSVDGTSGRFSPPNALSNYHSQSYVVGHPAFTSGAFTMTARVMIDTLYTSGSNYGTFEWQWTRGAPVTGVTEWAIQMAGAAGAGGYISGNTETDSFSDTFTWAADTWYLVKIYLDPNVVTRIKVWVEGTTEPATWFGEMSDVGGGLLAGDELPQFLADEWGRGLNVLYTDYIDYDYDGKPCFQNDCIVYDDFNRTVAAGNWGGSWTITAPSGSYNIGEVSRYSVDGQYGLIDVVLDTPAAVASDPAGPWAEVEWTMISRFKTGSFNGGATHGDIYYATARDYGGGPAEVTTIVLYIGGAGYGGVDTSFTVGTSFTWAENTWYYLKWHRNLTFNEIRIWKESDPEPTTWLQSGSDPADTPQEFWVWGWTNDEPYTHTQDTITFCGPNYAAAGAQTSGYVCESPADTGDHRHFQLAAALISGSSQVFVDDGDGLLRQTRGPDYTEDPSGGQIIFASALSIPEADSVYVCYTANGSPA